MKTLQVLLSLLLAGALSAASIQWETPRNISGPADFQTEGYYYGAWSPGQTSYPVGTVNGVQMRGDDLELTTSGFDGSGADFGTHATGDARYDSLLQHGTWSNGTSASFTINGTGRRPLTPGRNYLVQVWVSDARSYGLARTETVSGSGALSYQTNAGMGQFVIGRFTADATSQTVSLSANTSAQVNLVVVRDVTPEGTETRQQRWKRLKYGVFSHYTYAVTGDPVTAAERFNAEAYANDVAQAGAEYVVWTAWHSNTIPLFPSKVMDRYGFGGRHSERDAVSAMIDAVRAKGIRVFLYVHPYQPIIYDSAGHNNFINELFAEVMDRYGPRIDGLWIDENQINGDQDSVVDYKRLMQTIKSRNSDIVTMQNGGQMYTVDLGGPETVGDWNFARWQCMYNLANPGYGPGAEDMLRTTVLNAAGNYDGGGIHWSIDGVVDGGLRETGRIFQLGQYLAPIRASICGTKPSASFPPPFTGEQLRYSNVNQSVATEALDDSKVYIHVLKPPAGTVLTLPTPVDGKVFSSAKLLANGHDVGLAQNLHDGVRLILPETDTWDSPDTVIELTVASQGGAGLVNDTSRNITYTGSSWIRLKNRGFGEFADDIHVATANGDSFTFTFSGTDVDYITTRDANRGQVAIYIDHVLQTTVDLSSGSPTGSRQVAYSRSGLARGTHTLKGVKLSGTYMDVDCFKVADLVNDSDPEMAGAYKTTMSASPTYGGDLNWWQPGSGGMITPVCAYYPGLEPLNDPTNNEPVGGDWFDVTFSGTGIDIPLICQFAWAYFYVKVDGVFHSNIDIGVGQNKTLSISGLANGQHTVRCMAWRTTTDPCQPGHTGITITRPDAWTAAASRGYGELGDDVHFTDINPVNYSWSFDGSGVEAITTRDSDARMAWFGVTGSDVNLSARLQNFSQARQVGTSVFSLPHLQRGSHTLNISHGANTSGLNFSFSRLAIDAVRVFKGESLAIPGLSWGSGGEGGSGTWDVDTTANWYDGAAAVKWPTAGGMEDVASFGGAAGTVSLSGTVDANRLNFTTTGYTLQNGTLVLNGSGPVLAADSSVNATISSSVAGTAGLNKVGAGALTLAGTTAYNGATTIYEGALILQSGSASPAFQIEGGAVLDLHVASGSRDGISTAFTGRGTLRKSGAGQMVWGSGATTFSLGSGGLLDIQGGTFTGGSYANENWTGNLADLNVAGGAVFSGVEANVRVDTLTGTGTIRSGYTGAGYSAFTFGVDNGSGTFSGVLANDSAAGHFVKSGTGTQTLAGTNTYTGTTTVDGGTLLIHGSLAADSAVTVVSGATLGGTGTVGGTVAVQSGATLAPGVNGAGTLTVGSATLAGHLAVQIDGENVDHLAVNGNLDVSACTLDLSSLVGGITKLEYVIATYGSLTGGFAAVTGLPAGYEVVFDGVNKRILLVGQLTEAPRALVAVGGIGRVTLSWLKTVGGNEGTYRIERATGGGSYAVIAAAATGNNYVDTNVAASTSYNYIVRVIAGGSVGPASNVASATTATAGTLPPPLNQSANIGGYGTPGVTYSSGSYTLTGSGSGTTGTADSGNFLFVPVVGDCTIVAKVNSLGGSNASRRAGVMMRQTLDANAMEMGALAGPSRTYNTYRASTGGTIASSNKTTTIPRWVRITRTGNSLRGAHSPDGASWTQFTARTITMTGTVYVGLFVCSGDTSNTISSTFSNVSITGGSPTNLTATTTSGSINLAWMSVSGADRYNVKRATASGGPYTTIGSPSAAAYADTPPPNGLVYYYLVTAVSGLGESAASNELFFRPEMPVPATVSGLSSIGGTGLIGLSWSTAANASSYSVRRSTSESGPFSQIATTTGTGYTDTAVVIGTTYFYTVVGVNADNTGAACPAVSAVSSSSGTWTAESNGAWNTPGNWQDGGIAFGTGTSASFSQAATVEIDQNLPGLTLGSLVINGGNVTLANGALTLAVSSGTPSVSVAADRTLTLAGPIAGTLEKLGAGTLAITGTNTLSGFTVTAGKLLLENAAISGTLANHSQVEFSVTSDSQTYAREIGGSGSLAKTGTGMLTLTGQNSSSGGMIITGGTLVAARSAQDHGIHTLGSGNLTINNGGTLRSTANWATSSEWNGTTVGAITINQGGTWSIEGVGQTIRNGLFMNGGSITATVSNGDWGALHLKSGVTAGGGVTSSIAADTALSGSQTLTVNGSSQMNYSGVIHDQYQTPSGITKAGSGTLLLSGANNYSGVTDITAGTLVAAHNSAVGPGGWNGSTMTWIRDGATLALQGGISLEEHMHLLGSGVGGLGALRNLSGNNVLTMTYYGNGSGCGYALDGHTTIGVDAGMLTVTGFYESGGTFGLTKVGAGKLVLTQQQGYHGGTTVNGGTLELANGNAYGTGRIRGVLTINAGATVETSGDGTGLGWVDQISSVAINGGTLTSTGAIHVWNIPGGITMTGGTLQSNNGSSDPNGPQLEWNRTAVTTLASENSATIAGRIRMRADNGDSGIHFTVADGPATTDLLVSAVITEASGGMGITKSGPGTLDLGGNNSYTGPTSVSQGTLRVNGTTAVSSSLTIANLAILGGTGNIGGAVTVNSGCTLAPGNSVGTLTAGSVTLNGTLAIEIDGNSADRLNVSGNLNITDATLALTGTPTGPEYIIASFGSLTGAAFAHITGLPSGYVLDYTNNQVRLVTAPTPPSFSSWVGDNYPTLADKTPVGDPDNDGLENALEYVLGGDPSQPDSAIAPTCTTSGGDLVFTFQRALVAKTSDVSLVVQAGINLANWPDLYPIVPGTSGVTIQESQGLPDTITVRIPQTGTASRFVRLKVIVGAAP